MVELRNWEFNQVTGLPVVGATVTVYTGTLTHPPVTSETSGVTNGDGLWSFTGLTDTPKDVKVVANGQTKWYKGMSKHGVTAMFFEDSLRFKQAASIASAPGAGASVLAFKTDGEPIFRSGAAGAETKIATYTGATGVLKSTGWGTVATADMAANSVTNILLSYTAGSLHSGATITASTLFDFLANQSFTVARADSIVEIVTRGGGQVTLTAVGVVGSRMYIDSAGANTLYRLGSQRVMVANEFANPFAGAGPTFISGLSAGSHTVNFKLYSEVGGSVYMRASEFEFFHFQVIEHLR